MSTKMYTISLPSFTSHILSCAPHARRYDDHAPAILRSFLILAGRAAGGAMPVAPGAYYHLRSNQGITREDHDGAGMGHLKRNMELKK